MNINIPVSPAEVSHVTSTFCEIAELHPLHCYCFLINILKRKLSISCTHAEPKGTGTPLQHSCLENPMGGGAWWAAVHGVTKSRTRLSDFTFTFHFPALEKEMATPSSGLAWRIPGTGEPGGLPSIGSQSRTRLKRLSSSSSSRTRRHKTHDFGIFHKSFSLHCCI